MIKQTLFSLALIVLSINSCPWGNEPVCGVNYITYPNQCALAAAYVEELHPGPCVKKIDENTGEIKSNCPQIFLPVCGRDTVTYLNKCTLEDNEVALSHQGPCGVKDFEPYSPPLVCDCQGEEFMPVCSLAGYTYENLCVLNCT